MNKTIFVSKTEAEEIETWLNYKHTRVPLDTLFYSTHDTGTIKEWIVPFLLEDNVKGEVEIRIVKDEKDAYVEGILFLNGYETTCLDPRWTLLGDYEFEGDEDVPTVTVHICIQNSTRFIMEKE